MLLHDQVALITGASRGIGRAIATTFAAQGATVVITGRSAPLIEVAAEISDTGGKAVAVRGDLADEGFARELIQRCRQDHARIDVLVNNAGVLHAGLLGMTPSSAIQETFDVNVVAVIRLTQHAIRLMDPKRGANIVNVASIAGTRGLEGATVYSAAKGALVAFTRASAKELAPRGIRVNAVAPGFIDTDMIRDLSEAAYQKRLQSVGMGRPGTPEEVANVALFLASSLASYVTCQVLGVDGGMTG